METVIKLKNIINEICEDIFLSGINAECYLVINRKDDSLIDYITTLDVAYVDEKYEKTTLYNCLLEFLKTLKFYSKYDNVIDSAELTALRLITNQSQEEFAKNLGLSKKTIEAWEYGYRVPKEIVKEAVRKYAFSHIYTLKKKN